MEQIPERLSEKLHMLSSLQLVQVEEFVESLHVRERDRAMTRLVAQLSEPAFKKVWNNPEDEAYDAL